MKKILLISPPAHGLKDKISYPPLGLLYLASNLQARAYVEILNMLGLDEKITYDHDIFGISIHSVSSYEPARRVAQGIRQANKDALIVMGGSFPTSTARFTLETTDADVVVIGEGEKVFSNLCSLGSVTPDSLKNIKGIAYKANGSICVNPLEELIENLDDIKFPARDLLPRQMVRHEGKVHHSDKPATTIFATRGCPFKCSFCDTNLWRRKWRCRSPQNIISEIEQVINNYTICWFRFPDDCITINRNWFLDFCRKIQPCNVEWTILSRADTIDLEMLKLMKDAGCREIFFGFESGSQRLLDLMQKKAAVQRNIEAVELCRHAGILSCAYMMFGFPGEDEETIEQTKKFLLRARPDKSRISTFIPIPGTDVWENPSKYGVRIKQNFSDYWYFDDPDTNQLYPFALEYDYLWGGNPKMDLLRRDILNFYRQQSYLSGWTEPKVATSELSSVRRQDQPLGVRCS